MVEKSLTRTKRGIARVTFIAHLAVIRSELEQGWTAKAIYERHPDKLGAMSYPQFARYVRQLKEGAGLGAAIKAVYSPATGRFSDPPPAEPSQDGPATSHSQEGPDAYAGQQPASSGRRPARTFRYDPQERPGDYERLFGEPRKR